MVGGLDVESHRLATFVSGAGANGDHLAFLLFFLSRVGSDNPTLGLLFGVDSLDDDTIMLWAKLHKFLLSLELTILGHARGDREGGSWNIWSKRVLRKIALA